MLTDDMTRRQEAARERPRRPHGFLESQGATGLGWVASMEAERRARGGLSWADSAMANGVSAAEVDAARERRHQAEHEAWLMREQDRMVPDVARSAGAPRSQPEILAEVVIIREVEILRPASGATNMSPLDQDWELR